VDAWRLGRTQGNDLAIRPRSGHGLCRHCASHPDLVHGEATDPPSSHRAAHPALCEPGRHRHLGRAGSHPDGLAAREHSGRVSSPSQSAATDSAD
jgi:hypothetical protein